VYERSVAVCEESAPDKLFREVRDLEACEGALDDCIATMNSELYFGTKLLF
jgi:hypothetical protein